MAAKSGKLSGVLPMALIGIGSFLVALALMLALWVVPGLTKIPLDAESLSVTEPRPATVLNAKAFAGQFPTSNNVKRDECKKPSEQSESDKEDKDTKDEAKKKPAAVAKLPMSCFMEVNVPVYAQRRVTTVEPSNGDVVTLQAAVATIREDKAGNDGSKGLLSANIDRITYDRLTGDPVEDATSTIEFMGNSVLSKGGATPAFARKGIQYKFPFDTQRISYDYFDSMTLTTNPIEFKEETEVNGKKAFRFEQNLGPINMYESLMAHYKALGAENNDSVKTTLVAYRFAGTAGEWGLSGKADRKVSMDRYYTNRRQIWIDPVTGRIINGSEDMHQFYAENDQAAKEFFADKAKVDIETTNPTRTAVKVLAAWDGPTIERAIEGTGEGDKLAMMGSTIPWIAGISGVLAIIGGIVLGRRKQA